MYANFDNTFIIIVTLITLWPWWWPWPLTHKHQETLIVNEFGELAMQNGPSYGRMGVQTDHYELPFTIIAWLEKQIGLSGRTLHSAHLNLTVCTNILIFWVLQSDSTIPIEKPIPRGISDTNWSFWSNTVTAYLNLTVCTRQYANTMYFDFCSQTARSLSRNPFHMKSLTCLAQ